MFPSGAGKPIGVGDRKLLVLLPMRLDVIVASPEFNHKSELESSAKLPAMIEFLIVAGALLPCRTPAPVLGPE